jgi:hypothetical protein
LTRQGTHLPVQPSVPIVVEEGQGELDPKPLSAHVQERTTGRGITAVLHLPISFPLLRPEQRLCHDNSSDTQAYLDSARYCKLKVSELQAIAVTAG